MVARSPTVLLAAAAAAGAFVGVAVPAAFAGFAIAAVVVVAAAWVVRHTVWLAAVVFAATSLLCASSASYAVRARDARVASLPSDGVVVDGLVEDVAFTSGGATQARVRASALLVDGTWQPSALVIDVGTGDGWDWRVLPGDHVRVRGVLHALLPALSPGTLDAQLMGLSRGIDARVSLRNPTDGAVVARDGDGPVFARMRLALRERLTAQLTPREAGVLLALLIGDTSLIDDEERDIYRAVGAGHLLAVSGLQVALVALGAEWLVVFVLSFTAAGRRGQGRAAAAVAAGAAIWAFVFVCGAPPSAVRAGMMASGVLLARASGRSAQGASALGLAAWATLLVWPASIVDPSFLLSYAAVIGLAAVSGRVGSSAVATGIAASVAAGVATLPVSAYLFGSVSLGGIPANIVLVPVASLLQAPALLLGAVGGVADLPLLSWLGAELALLIEALTAGLGDIMGGTHALPSPGALGTVLLTACALGAFAALWRGAFVAAAAGVVGAVLVVVAAGYDAAGIHITFLPIGQGDSAVIEFPNGQVMVVDGGGALHGNARGPSRVDPGTDVLLPFLRRRGIDHIDVMVLSHPHPDHALGLIPVARAVPVRELWHNGSPPEGPLLGGLLAAVGPRARIQTTPSLLGVHTFGDGSTVDVIAPAPAEKAALYPELDANDNSLVLRVCFTGTCALLPGDIESMGEDLLLASGAPVKAALVKAPHHGSRTSSVDAFVTAVGATDVVFCTGVGNPFFFPHDEVVQRYRSHGARLWGTAFHGEVRTTLAADGLHVDAFRDATVAAPPRNAR